LRKTPGKARLHRLPRPITAAVESGRYTRRFHVWVLLVCFVVIALAVVFLVYNFLFKISENTPGPSVDLGSLFKAGSSDLPDPFNPCIVIQEHLEATRRGSYRRAYDYLATSLRTVVALDGFTANVKSNSLLFRDISGYRFSGYEVNGSAATVDGYIEYRTGGRSRVEAAFAKEGNTWRISEMNVVFR
jgi:hypothetical protein